ncbi:DUF4468 domain-containing protein [Apibacter raozihei]|uniref:DUF4468 domain-containing protein n=1 Tax=Apibacter raozihei TaxID=2500547 RepID=UPI0013E35570|nr:DUF4468 domain-containing protein [Apibacter raozihei]
MRKFILLLVLLTSSLGISQSKYEVEDGNIVVTKTIENIGETKDEIYKRVKSYFTRSYGSANSVIQTDDKEGGLVIGKGLYLNMTTFLLGTWKTNAYHILRIDIKDGRARIICTATTIIPNSSSYLDDKYEYAIANYLPITDKRAPAMTKKAQEEAFNALVEKMQESVESLAQTIKGEGGVKKEYADW